MYIQQKGVLPLPCLIPTRSPSVLEAFPSVSIVSLTRALVVEEIGGANGSPGIRTRPLITLVLLNGVTARCRIYLGPARDQYDAAVHREAAASTWRLGDVAPGFVQI